MPVAWKYTQRPEHLILLTFIKGSQKLLVTWFVEVGGKNVNSELCKAL